ncbi:DUF3592 domain-containing protein [Streptomyces sp. 891-h]|uniref:DUF3592 domain-containing protein n=1 Tax=unclassified Streptomyces TaxID=2593676 RepID=UPI001FAA3138|nr:DUF3592 domain-containing protein [Streptomyces sp. 891-h]UNZ15818.1 hypothetical protein HC362_00665 [Streptomyces sp. 891-h]
MGAKRPSRLTLSRGTARWGLLGAAGGLAVAALWLGSSALTTNHSSGPEGPAVLGVAIFMAGLVSMIAVGLMGLPWPYWVAVGVLNVLMVLPLAFHDDAVLDRRKERVRAVVSQLRNSVSQPSGTTTRVCRVRLPDGTRADVAGTGCDKGTRIGDRLTVYKDPEDRVAARLEVQMTAGPMMWLIGACVAGLVMLGARIGVLVGRRNRRAAVREDR